MLLLGWMIQVKGNEKGDTPFFVRLGSRGSQQTGTDFAIIRS